MYGFIVSPKEQGQLHKTINRVYKQGWIEKKKVHDQEYYRLTRLGRIRYARYKLQTFSRKRGEMATIVMFDIPEEKRTYRNFARQLLKQMDFTMLQQSVFITPYILPKEFYNLLKDMKILQHFLFVEGRINFQKS